MTRLGRTAYALASLVVVALLAGCSLAAAGPVPTPPSATTAGDPTAATPSLTPTASATPTAKPESKPEPTSKPTPTTPPPLLEPGDRGEKVRELQHRLRQLDWFSGAITGSYGKATTKAVKGFQGKRELAKTGDGRPADLDRRWSRDP